MRDVFFKQVRELAIQWRSVLGEGRDLIKNVRNKSVIMRLPHYLKDLA
ncbi:hypothetical protein [Bartonella senegalensis]